MKTRRHTISGISAFALGLVLAAAPRAMAQSGCGFQANWTLQFADSQDPSGVNGALNAFDGSTVTVWSTAWSPTPAPLPHEIQINLRSACIVSAFRLTPWLDAPYGRIGDYEFYVSVDGIDWGAPVATGTFVNDATTKIVILTQAKVGQYIRLRALSAHQGAPFTTVAELQVLVGVPPDEGFLGYFTGTTFRGLPTPCLNGGAAYGAGDPVEISYSCNGLNGANATFVDYFSDAAHGCPSGGAIYATGPTLSYICNGTKGDKGDPGEKGEKGDAGASATRAAGPCFDNRNRYVDCGNGTVTDTVTGLIWLKDASCAALGNHLAWDLNYWATSSQAVAELATGTCGLTDGSAPGDWRLPTKAEWAATIARAVALGCVVGAGGPPSLTDDWGFACLGSGSGSSFVDVVGGLYWSSTADETYPMNVWSPDLNVGYLGTLSKVDRSRGHHIWPVRVGPR